MNIELNVAASENRLQDVKKLYKKEDVLKVAIAMAAEAGHTEMLQYLLTLETTEQDRKKGLEEGLFYASQNGHIEIVTYLLANVNPKFIKRDRSALHAAAGQGHYDIVVKLLNAGVMVDTADVDGCSPLFDAVAASCGEIVKLLLENGADPNRKDNFALTPKALARRMGNKEIIKILKNA